MKHTTFAIAAGLAASVFVLPGAASAATYLFTYTGAPGSGASIGSGTITTGTANPAGSFGTPSELITGITGTFNGSAITALLSPGTFRNDNILYFPGLGEFNGRTTFLDINGLSFSTAAGSFNVYFGLDSYGVLMRTPGSTTSTNLGTNGTFLVTQAGAVPEPATWAMMLIGFALVGAATRYRRRRTAITFA